MIVEAFAIALAALTAYLWVLNRRVEALPSNERHAHSWLKDPAPAKQSAVNKE